MSFLAELQEVVAGIRERVGPAVIGLGRGWGRGSGVVVDRGLVLTNAHVLRGDDVAVTFGADRVVPGRVAGLDADLDLAVVSVDTGDVEPVEWSGDAEPALGAPVFALAHPGGQGLRVSFGLVTALGSPFRGPRGRRVSRSIEHSAPLPRGSSGGALVDPAGRLLGINTARVDGGLILALSADASVRRRAEALARGELPPRPRLGVALAPPRAARRLRAAVGLPERDGLLVHAVEAGSPAARAGVARGDLVIGAEGRRVTTLDDLFDALDRSAPAGTLVLELVRGNDERTVEVPLAQAKETR